MLGLVRYLSVNLSSLMFHEEFMFMGEETVIRQLRCTPGLLHRWRRQALWLVVAISGVLSVSLPALAQQQLAKVRVAYPRPGSVVVLYQAAQEWKLFLANGLDVELVMMNAPISAVALMRGDIDYVALVGTTSVRATLSGMPTRAVWIASKKLLNWLVARPQTSDLEKLKSKRIGVSAIGDITHVATEMAIGRAGGNPAHYAFNAVPPGQMLSALESGTIDAGLLNALEYLYARRKGFATVLDIGSLVEMPVGGLTTTVKTIKTRPEEVKAVIRALQQTKQAMAKSKDKTVDLLARVMGLDREMAKEFNDLYYSTWFEDGVPTSLGLETIFKAIQFQGQFVGKTFAFEDLGDAKLAIEVANELGYKR